MSEENTQPAATPSEPAASPERAGASAPVDGGQPNGEGAAAQPEQQGEGEGAQPQAKSVPEHRTVQGRISEYQRRAREAELRAARLEGEVNALRNIGFKQPQAQPEPAPAAPKGPPDPKSYPQGEFDPRYAADLAKHEIREEQRIEAERQAQAEREAAANAQLQQGAQRLRQTMDQAEAIADAEDGGWAANAPIVLEQAARVLPVAVVDAITESENPVHVAELIGRGGLRDYPLDLQKLRSMTPIQAARAIARLDAAVSLSRQQASSQPAPQPKPAPQPSPAPIPTVTQSGATPQPNPEAMSMADVEKRLEALRAQQRASWGG